MRGLHRGGLPRSAPGVNCSIMPPSPISDSAKGDGDIDRHKQILETAPQRLSGFVLRGAQRSLAQTSGYRRTDQRAHRNYAVGIFLTQDFAVAARHRNQVTPHHR